MYDSRLELLGRVMSRVILSFAPDLILLLILLLLLIGLAQTLLHDYCVCGRLAVEDHLVSLLAD
jgi:hypothetical protein